MGDGSRGPGRRPPSSPHHSILFLQPGAGAAAPEAERIFARLELSAFAPAARNAGRMIKCVWDLTIPRMPCPHSVQRQCPNYTQAITPGGKASCSTKWQRKAANGKSGICWGFSRNSSPMSYLSPKMSHLSWGLNSLSPRMRSLSPTIRRLSTRMRSLSPAFKSLSPRMRNSSSTMRSLSC